MGFDWKAFGAAFLDKQTEGIRKRRTDAEEYEDEQEELARENKKLIANRTLLAADASQMAQKAIELGATKEQVMAAMGSGALGIKTFYEKLLAAANQKGMQTLGAADVEAIIDMPEMFEVNPAFVDMSLNEMAEIQYGVKPRPGTETADVQTSDSILASMFGVSAMGQAKKKLQDTKYIGGMSIADVNELAAQSDYDSLFPNLGVNFFDKEFYGPQAASEFLKTLTDIQMDAVSGTAAEDFINAAGTRHMEKMREGSETYDAEYAARNEGVSPMDKEQDAREYLIQNQARSIIQGTIGTYGQTGLFDHQPSVDLIKKIMGEEFVEEELELLNSFNQPDQQEETTDTEEPTDTEQTQEEQSQETPQEETSDTTNQETEIPPEESTQELSEQEQYIQDVKETHGPRPKSQSLIGNKKSREWDQKYKGRLNEDGTPIIVSPRPADGGEKTKTITLTTGLFDSPVGSKKVTEAEYWDEMYGETHDPITGRPNLPELES